MNEKTWREKLDGKKSVKQCDHGWIQRLLFKGLCLCVFGFRAISLKREVFGLV